jgi:hypothetical protein
MSSEIARASDPIDSSFSETEQVQRPAKDVLDVPTSLERLMDRYTLLSRQRSQHLFRR